jgi:hypothetical protein
VGHRPEEIVVSLATVALRLLATFFLRIPKWHAMFGDTQACRGALIAFDAVKSRSIPPGKLLYPCQSFRPSSTFHPRHTEPTFVHVNVLFVLGQPLPT